MKNISCKNIFTKESTRTRPLPKKNSPSFNEQRKAHDTVKQYHGSTNPEKNMSWCIKGLKFRARTKFPTHHQKPNCLQHRPHFQTSFILLDDTHPKKLKLDSFKSKGNELKLIVLIFKIFSGKTAFLQNIFFLI